MVVLVVLLAILFIVALVQLIRYEKELRHMAQFLNEREKTSNSSMKVNLHSRGIVSLAKAINTETESHRAERRDEVERQNELRVSLAHLSHDIRTPLTGARGYVQLLEEEEEGATRKRYLDAIERRLDDLNHMLNQLFMFTQVNDPEHHLEIGKIDANDVLSQALLTLYPAFQEKDYSVELDFASEECLILGDGEALSRIMQNLIVNALRHGVDPLHIIQSGTTFMFSNRVEDPASIDTDRMFERFYKSDSTRRSQGSGLGLAIVAQLVEEMGASVSVELRGGVLYTNLTFASAK